MTRPFITYCIQPVLLIYILFFIGFSSAIAGNVGYPLPGTQTNKSFKMDLEAAIQYALRWNRQITIAEYQPDMAKEDVAVVNSEYDISVFSTGGLTKENRPTQSLLDTGSVEISELIEERWLVQVGLKKRISTGGTISLYQELDFLDSNSEFPEPNPQTTSRLRVELKQPLLKNIGDIKHKSAAETALVNVETARESVRLQISDIIYSVVTSYRQLQLEVTLYNLHKKNLRLAEDILNREQERLNLGISKPMDVDRTLSAIENRKSRLLRSLNRMQAAVNQLLLLLNSPDHTANDQGITIIPTDLSVMSLPVLTTELLVQDALMYRPEIKIANNRLASAATDMKLYNHMQLPELNLRADYTRNSLDTSEKDALKGVYNDSDPSYSVWLDFQYPLGNNGADAEYRKAHLAFLQAREEVKYTKDIVLQEIRSITQEIELSHQQIAASFKAQQAAARVLEGELANYELNRTNNKDLLQAQDLLAAAEGENYRAVADFNLKLAQLNRVKGTLLKSVVDRL